jgi:hypothetical protein
MRRFAFSQRQTAAFFIFKIMSMFGGSGDGGAAQQEQARQGRIRKGMTALDTQYGQFNDKVYGQAATDYTKATMPGMVADYQATKNNLTYALAKAGNFNSSTALQRDNSLGRELAKNESQIANNAQGQANALRAKVSDSKGQMVQQLESSADPQAISAQSSAATSQLRAPSVIQPLGNLFADWSNQYLNKMASNPNGGNIWGSLLNQGYGQANNSSSMMVQ